MPHVIECATASEFLSVLIELEPEDLIFRGQRDASWTLLPTLLRDVAVLDEFAHVHTEGGEGDPSRFYQEIHALAQFARVADEQGIDLPAHGPLRSIRQVRHPTRADCLDLLQAVLAAGITSQGNCPWPFGELSDSTAAVAKRGRGGHIQATNPHTKRLTLDITPEQDRYLAMFGIDHGLKKNPTLRALIELLETDEDVRGKVLRITETQKHR